MSNIQRLTMEQLQPDLARDLGPRVERLGYLGEFFRVMGNEPVALGAFNEFTAALKEALPDALTEVVALSVATLMKNDYERNQHERLSMKLGFTEAWITAVERLTPDDAHELDETQRCAQQLAIAMVDRRGHGCIELVEALVAATDERTAVAVLMLVGRYQTHALIVNALELAPPVPGIFEARTAR